MRAAAESEGDQSEGDQLATPSARGSACELPSSKHSPVAVWATRNAQRKGICLRVTGSARATCNAQRTGSYVRDNIPRRKYWGRRSVASRCEITTPSVRGPACERDRYIITVDGRSPSVSQRPAQGDLLARPGIGRSMRIGRAQGPASQRRLAQGALLARLGPVDHDLCHPRSRNAQRKGLFLRGDSPRP